MCDKDEFYDRPTREAEFWKDMPHCVGGACVAERCACVREVCVCGGEKCACRGEVCVCVHVEVHICGICVREWTEEVCVRVSKKCVRACVGKVCVCVDWQRHKR